MTLYDKIQERTDNAITGYVKPWKNRSVIRTLEGLKHAGADLTKGRVFDLVYRAFDMEGVDMATIIEVSNILHEEI